MLITIYILAGLLALVIILAAIGPKKYDVSRAIVIHKPVTEVFPYVKLVKNQDHWSPWKAKDPNMMQTYSGQDGTVGFKASWRGNKQVGEGSQTISGIKEGERIDTQMVFLKPFKSTSEAYYIFHPEDQDKTKIIWGIKGENKFPVTIMMNFINMDKAVGKDFDEGLGNLKRILEQSS